MNNIGDLDEAQAKGTKTGLTLGLAGSTVKDAYEMQVSITANGRTATNTVIKHALYTSVGNETLPPGVETVPPNVAFDRVLEQMLLRALRDMQKAGELTDRRDPRRAFDPGQTIAFFPLTPRAQVLSWNRTSEGDRGVERLRRQ